MSESRSFTPEFRVSAAQRILNGESVSLLGAELGIRRSVLYRWRDRYRKEGASGLKRPVGRPPSLQQSRKSSITSKTDLALHIAGLEAQVEQLELENGFLRRVFLRLKESRSKSSATHN